MGAGRTIGAPDVVGQAEADALRMSTEAGSRLGNGVRWPGETSAASRDLRSLKKTLLAPLRWC